MHNGIIENFRELQAELEADGVVFETETDTEVIAHLVTEHGPAMAPLEAVPPPAAAARRLRAGCVCSGEETC